MEPLAGAEAPLLKIPIVLAALCLVTALPAVAVGGNGYLMMVHGTFEPRLLPGPPIQEAAAATLDDGDIVLHVIPHGLDVVPVLVANPVLTLQNGAHVLQMTPNAPAAGDPVCEEETAIVTPHGDFSGPIDACLVFRIPAETAQTFSVTLLSLAFDGADGATTEWYNGAAHGMIHANQEGGGMPPADADALLTEPTPFVFETLVDPQP